MYISVIRDVLKIIQPFLCLETTLYMIPPRILKKNYLCSQREQSRRLQEGIFVYRSTLAAFTPFLFLEKRGVSRVIGIGSYLESAAAFRFLFQVTSPTACR